jgi:ABC-type transport system involved in multi-copper enzyme maturation permease subunit
MLRGLRLAWAMQRFELRLLLGACVLVLIAACVVTWRLQGTLAATLQCLSSSGADACEAAIQRVTPFSSASTILHGAIAYAPFLVGLFLGLPIIAREIESGTANLSWSLAPSRGVWLRWRIISMGLLVVVGMAMLGLGGELMTQVVQLNGMDAGFSDYAMRGPLIVVRGIAVFAIAVAIGALIGRQLPAFLLAGAVTLAVFLGINFTTVQIARAEAVPLSQEQFENAYPIVFDSALRDEATGELMSYDAYYDAHPDAREASDMPPDMSPVMFTIPASQYTLYVARESAVLLAVALLAAAVAFLAVRRRRPY